MLKWMTLLAAILAGSAALAGMTSHRFANIDGGELDMSDWAGRPILVVNTASQCGFTYQYEGLQKLYDTYKDQGLVVLAVPSDDFNQELATAEEVKDFCEISFGLDMPMADITHVRGPDAHPFYRDLADQVGFVPGWNFNKVLIGPDGTVVATWGSRVRPMSGAVTKAIEPLLQ